MRKDVVEGWRLDRVIWNTPKPAEQPRRARPTRLPIPNSRLSTSSIPANVALWIIDGEVSVQAKAFRLVAYCVASPKCLPYGVVRKVVLLEEWCC